MNIKTIICLYLISLYFLCAIPTGALLSQTLYQEPVVTQGTKNIIIVDGEMKIAENKFFYIIYPDNAEKLFWSYAGDTVTYPQGTWPALEHGKRYGYFFKLDTLLEPASNIVFSTQDNEVPDRIFQQFLQPLNDHWFNKQTFEIEYQFVDSAGIDSVFLFSRIRNQPWKSKPDSANYYAISDSSKDPVEVGVVDKIDMFKITVDEDNFYEFYLGAKDAAHHPMSCAKKWILNGNKDVPDSSSDPHLWIKIDTKEPYSEIIGLKEYYNDSKFDIYYSAYDSITNNDSSRSSGLETVSLYFIFNNNTIFADKDSFDSIDGIFNFHASQEGSYGFFSKALDRALNVQSTINVQKTVVDTTRPQITNFILLDILSTLTKTKAIADTGWTKNITVEAYVNASDNLSGLDSIFFSGNIDLVYKDTFLDFKLLHLAGGEGSKEVTCQVMDKAGNFSLPVNYNIFLDETPPELSSILLMDYDGDDTAKTNEMKIRVIPKVIDNNDTTVSHIALFENLEITPIDREKIWRTFSPNDTLIFDEFKEGPAPRWLKLHAVIRDHAGNVSNMVVDSIEYVPKLAIGGLSLEDLDGEVKNLKGEKFTNSLEVYVIVSEISRDPGSTAYFEFAKDSRFSESVVQIDYHSTEVDSINYSTRKVRLDLASLNHNEINDKKEVYVRLVSSTLVETTQAVSDNIFLDTTPPVFGTPGVLLLDMTKSDDPNYLTFKADPGWTNEKQIEAHILDCHDLLSGCDSLHFWNDVEEIKVPFENIVPLTLLWETTRAETAYVSARDSIGNWCDVSKATILYDKNPPLITIQSPNEDESILQRDTLFVELYVNDLPELKNLSKIWYCEEGRRYDHIELYNLETNYVTIPIPISSGEGRKTICMIAVDKAGNPSDLAKRNINFIAQVDTFHERVRNVPNPFNASRNGVTKIIITSRQEGASVDLKIYDVFGNLVKSWPDEKIKNKLCEIEWNGKNGEGVDVGEGAYICIAKIGSRTIKKTKIGVLRR